MVIQIKNIVMADDDQDDVYLFQSAIEETCESIALTVAMDGAKLMQVLNHNPPPDAIFLDLNMVGKSGKDCLEEIRMQEKFKTVPIMILSTSSNKQDIAFCLGHGANHYFVKPDTYQGIVDIVEALCSGKLTNSLGLPVHGSGN